MPIDREHVGIVEVKLSHTNSAWWQVRKLYEPIIRFMFPHATVSALEVTRFYDPHQNRFPEPIVPIEDPLEVPIGKFGMHLYTPSREPKFQREMLQQGAK